MKKTAIRGGRWTDPETWDPPGVPSYGDDVVIPGSLLVRGREMTVELPADETKS